MDNNTIYVNKADLLMVYSESKRKIIQYMHIYWITMVYSESKWKINVYKRRERERYIYMSTMENGVFKK